MSGYRLLIDVEVLEFLRTLSSKEQTRLIRRFREIAAFPSKYSDYTERDASARPVGVHVFGRFAIKFWDDFADRQLKILDVHLAD